MTFLAGDGTGLGRDYTVFATVTGKVHFEHQTKTRSASGSRPSRPQRETASPSAEPLADDHRRA